MRIRSCTLVLVLTNLVSHVFAQKDYAVLLKGDTLKGELKFFSFDNVDQLQVNSGGKKTKYTALQVRGFNKGGIAYQAMKYDRSIRFMRVLKSGYLSLLEFNTASQGSWDGRYLGKRDGSGIEVPNIGFKKILSKFLDDCPDVKDKIENGTLAKRDIEKIVDEYNACLQTKTDAVIRSAGTISSINEKTTAITKLKEKVTAENFITKKDVLDLLQDMQNKVSKNEAIPNFLTEGLKSYLADTPALLKEAEELIVLLKK